MFEQSRYCYIFKFFLAKKEIIHRLKLAIFISVLMSSHSMFGFKNNYTILGIGDSNMPYTFRNIDQDGADVFFNKDVPTYRTVTLDNNEVIDMTYHIYGMSGKTIHGLKVIPLYSLINPELISTLDFIICCFGTVDARIHAYHQSKIRDIPVTEVIDDVVIPYIQNILSIKEVFPEYKGKLIVMATLPVSPDWEPKEGDLALATDINNTLNFHIQKYAEANGIYFFNPFVNYTDEQGLLDERYKCDGTHFKFEYNYLLVKEAALFIRSLDNDIF